MQATSQGELHFAERSLLLVEAQKLSRRANLPSRTFETSLLRAVHGPIPRLRIQAVVVLQSSLHVSITLCGVYVKYDIYASGAPPRPRGLVGRGLAAE